MADASVTPATSGSVGPGANAPGAGVVAPELTPFAHLHVHTQYSFLQSTIKVGDLVKRAKAEQMPALAITDTNNIFGAIDFYFACKDAGIKPIIGCELVYCPDGRDQVFEGKGKQLHSLVVLCKDKLGYQNLSKMLSQAFIEGVNNKTPLSDLVRGVVDRELLDKYGDGLVVLSGSIRGEIPYKILTSQDEEALKTMQWFQKRFGEDFYLEVVDNGLPEQESVNQQLLEMSQRYGVQLVGTSESYYLDQSYAEAQEILQCIPLGRNLDFERPKSLVPPEFSFKSGAVMKERLEAYQGAYENALKIADKCNLQFKFKDAEGKSIYHLPKFRPVGVNRGDDFDELAFFRDQSRDGLEKRFLEPEFSGPEGKKLLAHWPELEKEYRDRLELELGMIEKTGFAGYFLIVSDFILWAKQHDIPVGPGRGSGAGSLVAYALFITDIDPIEFKLLFERFINPERVSMPDFDIDFCQERRGEVIRYVESKYGKENVSQIITFGKLQAKAVIKDVGRVLGLQFAETNKITELFPNELNIRLKDAYDNTPDLRAKIESEPKLQKVWEYAIKLEGLYRNAGMHAAGVIITEEPIVNYCPLYVSKDGDVVTQFDKDYGEKIGLVKFDFLGLKTLTVIDKAVKFIRAQIPELGGVADFDLKAVSYKDSKVFDLISSGNTNGVFQIESDGMKDLCKRIVPSNLEDITAINALYRPGPLGSGMVDDFIDRKHGRLQTTYELPELETILADTYGVILYQEQVMQVARDVAGYSLGQADMLRRAMGKKKADEMAKHKDLFVEGALKRKVDQKKASDLFDLMAKFAEYGFNKSHSAAYGVITYQTAYLKTYYPVEFMAALMTTEMSDTDKLSRYTADARAMGITVLPPDVNSSVHVFTVEALPAQVNGFDKAIRFGLEAIKGVGGTAVDGILEARNADGKFTDVLDFAKRTATRKVNKKVYESLIVAGGFDSLFGDGDRPLNRASLFVSIENLVKYGQDEAEKAELGQNSLFDDFKAEEVRMSAPVDALIKREAEWPLSKRLLSEKAAVGFFISGHPMQNWQAIVNDWIGTNTDILKDMATKQAAAPAAAPQQQSWGGGGGGRPKRKEVKIAGIFGEFKEIMTKKGSKMAFMQLEDILGRVEVIAFPEFYTNNAEALAAAKESPEPILITGEFDVKEGEPKILANAIQRLEDAHGGREVTVVVELDPNSIQVDQLRSLKQYILQNRGKSLIRMQFNAAEWRGRLDIPPALKVAGTPQFAAGINKIFGQIVAKLQ